MISKWHLYTNSIHSTSIWNMFFLFFGTWTHTTVGLFLKWRSSSTQKENHCFWRTWEFSFSFAWVHCHLSALLLLIETKTALGSWVPLLGGCHLALSHLTLCLSCLTKQPLLHWPCLSTNSFTCWVWFSFNFVIGPEAKVEMTFK